MSAIFLVLPMVYCRLKVQSTISKNAGVVRKDIWVFYLVPCGGEFLHLGDSTIFDGK